MPTYSIFYLMHSLLILIFISVSIFFFHFAWLRFSLPSVQLSVDSAHFALVAFESWFWSRLQSWLWGWLVSAIKWTNEGYKTIRFGFLFSVFESLYSLSLFLSSLASLSLLHYSILFCFCFLFSLFLFLLAKVFYYYMYFLFLVDLLGWSLYLYLAMGWG